MKTSTQIIEESGFGVGYEPTYNEIKRQLAMGADIILDQERQNPTGDRALATTMALCSLVNSQVQIGVMAKSGINPFLVLREKRAVLAGETITAMAKMSANYGSGETRETFLAWRAAGCPTGSAYVSWLSAPSATASLRPHQSGVAANFDTIARSIPMPIDGDRYQPQNSPGSSGAPAIQVRGIPSGLPSTVKLTASQESIARQMSRDPAEVAAWRARNMPGQ